MSPNQSCNFNIDISMQETSHIEGNANYEVWPFKLMNMFYKESL
jgi:hypothetical protein